MKAALLLLALPVLTVSQHAATRCPIVDCSGRCLPSTFPKFSSLVLPILTDSTCDDGVETYFNFNCPMWEVDGKWCSHEDRAQTEGEGTRSISQSLRSAPPGLRNEGHVEAYLQSRLEERVAGVGGLAPPDGEQLFKEAVTKSRKSLGSRGAPPRDVPDSAARIRRMIASLKEELKDMKTGDPRADDVKEQLAALFNQEKEIVHGAKRADEVIEAANRKIFQLRKSLEEDNLSDSAKESVLRHIQGIEKSTKANLDYIDSHTNRDVNGASRRTTANTIDAEVLRKEREEEADEINTLGKSTRIGTRRKGAATYTMSKSKSKEL